MLLAIIDVFKTDVNVKGIAPITAGLVGATVEVRLDPSWDDYNLTFVWVGCGKCIIDTTASGVIPHEVVEKDGSVLRFGVYGTKGGIETPTVWANLGFIYMSVDPTGDPSTDPTLPVWAQLQEQIADLKENGSQGGGGKPGENGGYYTPSVTQPNSDTLNFSFAPSKEDMPAIESFPITLPAGPKGDDYSLTAADKAEIAEMAAGLVKVPDSGGNLDLGVTGATVGQTVKISAVDENGVPTAWESVNFPDSYTKPEIDAIMGSYVTDIDALVGGDG